MKFTLQKSQPAFYLKTYGCQMNFHDSEILSSWLEERGWKRVGDEREASLLLLNTCSVRRHAEERVLGKLGEYGHRKRNQPQLVIGVIGCMAQLWGKKLWKYFPWLDLILGPGSLVALPQALDRVIFSGIRKAELGFRDGAEFIERMAVGNGSGRAWVTIMRGCDNFCSYCVVPFSRGREVSRSPESIIGEVERQAAAACREVTLLGQNVNSYRGRNRKGEVLDFPDLLHRIQAVAGIERVRFVTSHPKDISPKLIAAMERLSKVCEHLHFPAQSGSNAILEKMNRSYTREEYLKKVERLRQAIPGIALSSDFIVGFPGEREKEFKETMRLVDEVQFDQAFIFKYSPRPQTKAIDFADDVPAEIKRVRHQVLSAAQERISLFRNRELLGKEVEILVEGRSPARAERAQGRTRTNKIALLPWQEGLERRLLRRRVKRVTARALYTE